MDHYALQLTSSSVEEKDWALLPATVLQVLGRHLSRKGLRSAVELCKLWRDPIRLSIPEFSSGFYADTQPGADVPSARSSEMRLAHVASLFPKLQKLVLTFQGGLADPAAAASCLPQHFPALANVEFFLTDEDLARDLQIPPILTPLTAMRSLESLVLHVSGLKGSAWFAPLAQMTNLTNLRMHLEFDTSVNGLDVTLLATLTSLRHFELHVRYGSDAEQGVQSAAFVTADALRKLAGSWLQLEALSITAAAWDFDPLFSEGLQWFTCLQALSVSVDEPYNDGAPCPPLPAAAVNHIPASIRVVTLCNLALMVLDAASPPALPQLQALELLGCTLSVPDVVRVLEQCPHLRTCTMDRQPLRVNS